MFQRSLTALGAAVVVTALAAGCGSSSTRSVTSPQGTSPAAAAPTTTAPTTTAPTSTAPTTTAPAADTTGFSTGSVPVVSGSTDLGKEPKIHAGTGAPRSVLVGKNLVIGTGALALPSSTVTVAYVGTIYQTGRVFDASWTDGGGAPVSFPLTGVIPGFKDAIVGMRVGGRREIVIPPAYGYGSTPSAAIPANSTLVFVIDLTKVS